MIIKSAKPITLAIMVILLVGIAVVDVQGNAEAKFTLRGIKANNPTTFGDNIPNSNDKEKHNQLITALGADTNHQTPRPDQSTDRYITRERYCQIFTCP
ncbi:unnamed protein product [Urochloa humidicola]